MRYALGIGGNRRTRYGTPRATVLAGLAALGLPVLARSRVIETAPLGPGARRFANLAAVVETDLAPPALLARAKQVERAFGRRPGRRWGDRPLDIDLLLWSGGSVRSRTLRIPHPALARRRFALLPLAEVARAMPGVEPSVRPMAFRLTRPVPVHRSPGRDVNR